MQLIRVALSLFAYSNNKLFCTMFNNMTSKLKCIKYVIGDNLEKSVED